MTTIAFTICVGIRAPIEPGEYFVREKRIQVSYPGKMNLSNISIELPKSLSTMFIVSWEDCGSSITKQLRSESFQRFLPVYVALDAISELLLAFKLVRIGHIDGLGLRTVGIGDTLLHFSSIDGVSTGDLNIGLKDYAGNNAWLGSSTIVDPDETTKLAMPHIGNDTLPLARRYVRCYELLEHGFYSEAFIVAFSVLDDFIQQTLHDLLLSKGLMSKSERNELLRGIKENRLKLYLGPLLKLAFGRDIEAMWPGSMKALEWMNGTRNRIAHAAEKVDYATAAQGIYACVKVTHVLCENGVTAVELNVELFRHAKLTAAWTANAPDWVPFGEVAESMDFHS